MRVGMIGGRVVPLLAAVLACGCGTTAAKTGAPAAAVSAPAAPAAPAATTAAPADPRAPRSPIALAVRTAPGYGKLVVDGKGRTLYLFTADGRGGSACDGACAVAWPPLIARSPSRFAAGIVASRVSVVRRADGRRQLAYYGHPLYYYVGDRQPGQINCQDAEEYGGHWWLVTPGGGQNRRTP